MSTQTQRDLIFVASTEELKTPSYYRRLWLAVKNLKIPRRRWLTMIADAIRDYDGLICYYNGLSYPVPDVDEAFGNDPDIRWLGYYLETDERGWPRSRSQKIERLRLMDLYFKICRPDLARHFGR